MELKVFKAPKAETPSPVYLALWQLDERVVVSAVNEFGAPIPGGNLLAFKDDGTITRYGWVAEGLGFKLNKAGRIKLSDPGD